MARRGFVTAKGSRFLVDGRPFRFVGANVAVIYGNEERTFMPDTMREAARDGIQVVRIWAFGESDAEDSPGSGVARNEWLKLDTRPDGFTSSLSCHPNPVRAEPVEVLASRGRGFDRLSPNGIGVRVCERTHQLSVHTHALRRGECPQLERRRFPCHYKSSLESARSFIVKRTKRCSKGAGGQVAVRI